MRVLIDVMKKLLKKRIKPFLSLLLFVPIIIISLLILSVACLFFGVDNVDNTLENLENKEVVKKIERLLSLNRR